MKTTSKKQKLRRICRKCGVKFVNNGANCKLCDDCWKKSNTRKRKLNVT